MRFRLSRERSAEPMRREVRIFSDWIMGKVSITAAKIAAVGEGEGCRKPDSRLALLTPIGNVSFEGISAD